MLNCCSTNHKAIFHAIVHESESTREYSPRHLLDDYCNAVLTGLPDATLTPLQRVLNASARLILDLKPRDHVTSALKELHLAPDQRIEYKLCLLVYLSINDRELSAIYATSWHLYRIVLVGHRCVPHRPEILTFLERDWERGRSRSLLPLHGTNCRSPEDIKCATTTALFKKKLKKFLF